MSNPRDFGGPPAVPQNHLSRVNPDDDLPNLIQMYQAQKISREDMENSLVMWANSQGNDGAFEQARAVAQQLGLRAAGHRDFVTGPLNRLQGAVTGPQGKLRPMNRMFAPDGPPMNYLYPYSKGQ